MYIEKEHVDKYMDKILERVDSIEARLSNQLYTQIINGKPMLDNQDMCKLLKVGKKTLQRYRTKGALPHHRHEGMIYYDIDEIQEFIKNIMQ